MKCMGREGLIFQWNSNKVINIILVAICIIYSKPFFFKNCGDTKKARFTIRFLGQIVKLRDIFELVLIKLTFESSSKLLIYPLSKLSKGDTGCVVFPYKNSNVWQRFFFYKN